MPYGYTVTGCMRMRCDHPWHKRGKLEGRKGHDGRSQFLTKSPGDELRPHNATTS